MNSAYFLLKGLGPPLRIAVTGNNKNVNNTNLVSEVILIMFTEKEPTSLLEAITRISSFSYEPLILKYPYFEEYLKKYKDPKAELTLWMTAAGAGYALVTKETYVGEHDEIINSIEEVDGLSNLVEDIAKKFHSFKGNEKERGLVLPIWIISNLKNEKPTKEDIDGPGIDMAKLLDSCIRDYEVKQLNKNL